MHPERDPLDRPASIGRGLVFLWSVITLFALVAIAGSICTVLLSKAVVPGLLPVYRLLRQSPVWHLAFWDLGFT